jgi:serine/threonine protein kinase
LGRYELLVELGVGGMASVWIAREPSEMGDRLIALKAMLPELARQPEFRTMFLEEGQIVRSIEHPHVVRVYEVGEDRGILFMAMEWVHGDSLRAIIREARRRRPIPPEMAVRIIADTAAGLHRPLLPQLLQAVRPGGVAVLRTFSSAGAFAGGPGNPAFVLRPGELLEIFAGWDILLHEEGIEPSRKGGALAGIVARRPLAAVAP